MTTIAVKRNDDGSLDIGWDSKVTPDGHHPGKAKIVNDQFVLGIAGYCRYSDILQYTSVPPIHPADLEDPDYDFRGYIITQVIPKWVDVLEKSYEQDPDTHKDWLKGSVVIVIGTHVYSIDHGFAVVEHLDHYAVGSGGDFALAALHMGRSVKKSLEVAAELDAGTDGPFTIIKNWK